MAKEDTNGRDDYHLVSPTALLVADYRRFTDIPNSNFVAELTNARETTLELLSKTNGMPPSEKRERAMWISPLLETRYKGVGYLIEQSGCENVLCVAEGISTRPYNLTENPNMRVVATDLPDMIEKQRSLVDALCKLHGTNRPDLYTRAVDVVNQPDRLMAAACLATQNGKPMVMVSEGLVPYFHREDQKKWFNHSYEVCAERKGTSIATDMLTKDRLGAMMKAGPLMVEIIEAVSGVTQSDLMNNAFENEEHIRQMAKDAGFSHADSVKPYQNGRNFSLASLQNIPFSPQDLAMVNAMVNNSEVWVFKP